jgi:hypothetical protein
MGTEQNGVIMEDNEEHENNSTSENEKDETTPIHPIAAAIDSHVLRICDLRTSAFTFMKQAASNFLDELEKQKEILVQNGKLLNDEESQEQIIVIKNVLAAQKKLYRLYNSELLKDLAVGHFLTLFATFDSFSGDLLTASYQEKPDLFNAIDRSMTISEMLEFGNVDDIKKIILDSEIEAFRRKSYVDQFQVLENRFGINLRKFKNWAKFVECGQRRNLFTHCDGRVSEQYLAICRSHECKLSKELKVGEKLEISPDYLHAACNLIIEVILKLGQTVWRKLLPDDIEKADSQLISIQYDFLSQGDWPCAIMAGNFAINLPKHANTVNKIILTVNLIIALKNCELDEEANKLLDSIDWSALCNDFRLAEKVLREDYDAAMELMEKIGTKGDFVIEHSYHVWPLFSKFRETTQFLKGYKQVFGYDFSTKLKNSAEESRTEIEAEISKKKEDLKASSNDTEKEFCPPREPQPGAQPDSENACGLTGD